MQYMLETTLLVANDVYYFTVHPKVICSFIYLLQPHGLGGSGLEEGTILCLAGVTLHLVSIAANLYDKR